MTSYNVTQYLPTAVRSILQQSYRNLELIIVDDASTDATPDLLMEIERSDPRVKVILKSTNDGTYVSKNLGILQSQGEIIALQDSDDWSHPDRIACSVGVLLRHPEVMGLTTDWLRMTTDGDIVIKAGGQISHRCCISLVFRRAPVMDRLGFFDSVRIAADLEFIQRMGLVFGENAVPRLRWPLLFGRARSDSLTASEEFGVSRTGFTEPRQVYHRHSEEFHARIVAGAPAYLPFPQLEREFKAPAIILPSKGND
jgi:glycosyltransferase involved in cell wall biosynthesis